MQKEPPEEKASPYRIKLFKEMHRHDRPPVVPDVDANAVRTRTALAESLLVLRERWSVKPGP